MKPVVFQNVTSMSNLNRSRECYRYNVGSHIQGKDSAADVLLTLTPVMLPRKLKCDKDIDDGYSVASLGLYGKVRGVPAWDLQDYYYE